MREERDSHEDLAGRYARYAQSRRKRKAWDAANPGNVAIREEIAQKVLPLVQPPGQILDIGCGTGWWLERLAGTHAGSLHGVDVLPERVASAAARVPAATVQRADARQLPFDAGSFRLVTLFTVLSSMPDRSAAREALAEARRVTAPGGRIVVWDMRVPNPANRGTIRLRRADYRSALGADAAFERVTLLPPLARRIGPALYRRLAAIPPLTTHWLVTAAAGPRPF